MRGFSASVKPPPQLENTRKSSASRTRSNLSSNQQEEKEEDMFHEQWCARMLVLAVNWNRKEIVQDLLKMVGPRNNDKPWHPLDEALQRVYELRHGEILEVLLQLSDLSTANVRMGAWHTAALNDSRITNHPSITLCMHASMPYSSVPSLGAIPELAFSQSPR